MPKRTTRSKKNVSSRNVSTAADPVQHSIGQANGSRLAPEVGAVLEKAQAGNGVQVAPHTIIDARAGCGKTTVLVGGIARMMGLTPSITPTEQQEAIWSVLEQTKGGTVCFVAFNKSIATELQNRVPKGCDAMTMHSLGFRAVTKALGRQEPNGFVVQDLVSEIMGRDLREIRKYDLAMLKAVESLVSLVKMNLTGTTEEELDQLAAHYDVELNGNRSKVYELVPQVIERCKSPRGKITFDDMIWLPVILNLPTPSYDVLLVDEAQDLNRCQQALARKVGKRLILCGDPRQAIYGFAGADAESMPRMATELGATDVGCVTLPLTKTRRCGKAIVAEAARIVGDFEAFESNPEGSVIDANFGRDGFEGPSTYHQLVQDGDMILCRVNAPLVSQCFRFIRQGRRANIQGRDIGQGLISLVNKQKAQNMADLIERLGQWLDAEQRKENAKRRPSEPRLIALQDKYDCLMCFCEDTNSVAEVVAKIERIFTDDRGNSGIKLSSIHKAKGLESKRVFLLQIKGASVPHPMAKTEWQQGQEQNLLYVAITRAIEQLVYVYGG